jgi:hypothetical protein
MSDQIGKVVTGQVGTIFGVILSSLGSDTISAITSMALTITRSDSTNITATLTPGDIVNGAAQYVWVANDLSVSGIYKYHLTLNLSGSRIIPVCGTFKVEEC